MKYLKYLLLIFIIFLTPNVFAAEFNMSNNTSATQDGTKGYYNALEIYNSGSFNRYKLNTRYNGQISTIETFFQYPFVENTTYRFTYNMATEDFRNNFGTSYWWDCSQSMSSSNAHTLSVNYISYKKIQYSIKPSSNTTCIKVELRSRSTSSVPITGISNWNLSSITLYDPDWQSGSGSGQGSATPSPSPSTNQDIINNQNNNTENIINNNNENTQDIINNNNENTDKIIENQNANDFTCATGRTLKLTPMIEGSFISSTTDTITQNPYFNVSNYIYIKGDQSYTLDFKDITDMQWGYFCFYNNEDLISCTVYRDLPQYGILPFSITSPYNANRLKLTYRKDSGAEISGYICTNKNDDTTNAINQQNQYLMDNSDPNIPDSEFTSLLESVNINNPLSSLLQLPVQFVNAIVNQSNTCQVVSLGTLLGVAITLPCIDIGSILGSSVWNTIDILSSIGLIVLILKQIYESITNALTLGGYMEAKKGGLGYMPPLEFLCSIITGGGDF